MITSNQFKERAAKRRAKVKARIEFYNSRRAQINNYTSGTFDEKLKNGATLIEAFATTLANGILPGGVTNLSEDEYCASRLSVKSKIAKIVPFVWNKAQYHFMQHRTGRDIIVKARQLGFSTLVQALIYMACCTRSGVSAVTVANEGDNTSHLVEIFERFHTYMNYQEKPRKRGRYPNGMKFPDKDSAVYVGTANNRNWGRSKTIHYAHFSEIAYWRFADEIMAGIMESVPGQHTEADTWVVLESTANGASGFFYEEVQRALRGESEFTVHFYAWWWASEYAVPMSTKESIKYSPEEAKLIERVQKTDGITLTPAQIKWRRNKIQERGYRKFQQEYPESVQTAFLTSGRPYFDLLPLQERLNTQIIKPVYHDLALMTSNEPFYQLRIYEPARENAAYVIGADTAEGILTSSGTDYSTAVVRDKLRNEQVATIHGKFTPFEFAKLVYELALYYNGALVGVERNNHGHAVLGHLIKGTANRVIQPYANLYIADDGREGWLTSSKTRPIMLDDLALEYKQPNVYKIRDEFIIGEAMRFVVHNDGKASAAEGSHDDLVLADAIAGQMRQVGRRVTQTKYKPVQIGEF